MAHEWAAYGVRVTVVRDTLRGKLRFGQDDHEAGVPVYVRKIATRAHYRQPILDVDEVVPASTTLPSKAIVDAARQ